MTLLISVADSVADSVVDSVAAVSAAMTVWATEEMTEEMCGRMISSCSFLRTWHVSRSGVGMRKKDQQTQKSKEENDEKAATQQNMSAHLSVPEQEMYWLIQSKRETILRFISNQTTETIQNILLRTVQVTTSDSSSYQEWSISSSSTGIDQNSIKNRLQQVTTYVDGSNTFYIDVQNSRLSYQHSSFSPVPEEITRTWDFKSYFKNNVPHCAALVKSNYLESVHVVKGNLLIESWDALPQGSDLDIRGCPSDIKPDKQNKKKKKKEFQWETNHPYRDANDMKKRQVRIKGAWALMITFDSKTKTEEKYDYLTLYLPNGETIQLTGEKDFKRMITVPGDRFSFAFHSDGSGNEWGIKMIVKQKNEPINPNSMVYYGGNAYGGPGRCWKYGEIAPSDCSWIESIMNPVVHANLTVPPKRGRGHVKWMEFTIKKNGQDVKVPASDTCFLLPTAAVGASTTVSMLMLLPKLDVWKIVTCNKLYHFVEVYNLDVFGRRGYPKLCYSSDSRLSFSSLPSAGASNTAVLFPPSPITRFAVGNMLVGITGGKDVVITDQNEGTHGPKMLLPARVTNSLIPGALSQSFQFWEYQETGNWVGLKKTLTRQTEKGTVVPYIDSFYDYAVEVKFISGGVTTGVVRKDVDPVTLQESGRRLINLSTSTHTASMEVVRLLTQIESLSHILAWSRPAEKYEDAFEEQYLVPELIDCPRLRARFKVAMVEGTVRLYLVDSGGKYILSDQINSGVNPQLLAGIPSHLILGRSSGNIYVMTPNCPLARPKVAFCPFTTSTTTDLSNHVWHYSCNSRYFLYEVHPSDTFVLFKSIGATLYWAFLKLMHREYIDAFQAIVSCGTDMRLTWSEFTMLSYFKACEDDHHPNAHACLLKLRLVLQYR